MGESKLTIDLRSEAELIDFAGAVAQSWLRAGCFPLIVGLRGGLGAGKTTWVRALLRGLGYGGRVPSPTYTLLESYSVATLVVVHLDLYRLAHETELENLGLRDWLEKPSTWVLVEWPERAPQLEARCDVLLELVDLGGSARRIVLHGRTPGGNGALRESCQARFNYTG
jgi:tRNA threonylcarbamoyladenosine biosynthesis protein TsaE